MRGLSGSVRFAPCSVPIELNGGGRFFYSRENFVPAYLRAFAEGILQERADEAIEALQSCRVCPRNCEIDGLKNKIGGCKSGRLAGVSSASRHRADEDCPRGWSGAGPIFHVWGDG